MTRNHSQIKTLNNNRFTTDQTVIDGSIINNVSRDASPQPHMMDNGPIHNTFIEVK